MTFSDLKGKDVVNVRDGRRLGKPIDLMFNEHACIEAIVVPAPSGFAGLFSRDRAGTVIPWSRICRLGDDVILVEIEPSAYEECR